LYAATKRANELIARVYALQFGLRLTGLRYFTVYGPWGRPDMAPVKFARALLDDQPIEVYGEGTCEGISPTSTTSSPARWRRWTTMHTLARFRTGCTTWATAIGTLMHFIEVLARLAGRRPNLQMRPMQAGDVRSTAADIDTTTRELGWRPTTRSRPDCRRCSTGAGTTTAAVDAALDCCSRWSKWVCVFSSRTIVLIPIWYCRMRRDAVFRGHGDRSRARQGSCENEIFAAAQTGSISRGRSCRALAVALGWPALDRLHRLGSTLFVAPFAACDALCGLLIQLARDTRWAALRRQRPYHDLQPLVADLNVEQLADPCFARGLYPLAFDAYSAQIDRLAGQ